MVDKEIGLWKMKEMPARRFDQPGDRTKSGLDSTWRRSFTTVHMLGSLQNLTTNDAPQHSAVKRIVIVQTDFSFGMNHHNSSSWT